MYDNFMSVFLTMAITKIKARVCRTRAHNLITCGNKCNVYSMSTFVHFHKYSQKTREVPLLKSG